MFAGFIAGGPIVLWQLWKFITPGLKRTERRYAVPFILSSILFFALGVIIAYITFNHALAWLQSIGGKQLITDYNPNQYLTLFLLMMVIFGLTFEFPVVLVALELARVVTSKQLLARWRYAVIAITIVAATITPSSDPFSMLALALPLTFFYFAAIGVGKLLRR
jgi:sec-independent protein translocase protein TatC